jgi:hypothetical protein
MKLPNVPNICKGKCTHRLYHLVLTGSFPFAAVAILFTKYLNLQYLIFSALFITGTINYQFGKSEAAIPILKSFQNNTYCTIYRRICLMEIVS